MMPTKVKMIIRDQKNLELKIAIGTILISLAGGWSSAVLLSSYLDSSMIILFIAGVSVSMVLGLIGLMKILAWRYDWDIDMQTIKLGSNKDGVVAVLPKRHRNVPK